MKFCVAKKTSEIDGKNIIGLITDAWDDWFTFNTMYTVVYIDEKGEENYIGSVKIGEANQTEGRPGIPINFEKLNSNFFSLGQSDEYYIGLTNLGGDTRDEILSALNDIAYNNGIYEEFKEEKVMCDSLMRSVSQTTILGQYHRLAKGKARLSKYDFNYSLKSPYEWEKKINIHFEVHPDSKPPTNVHVLIGRNGVGKTHLLTNMVKSILTNDGLFYENDKSDEINDSAQIFAGLVFVSFSAFDYDIPIENTNREIRYNYIGLKKKDDNTSGLVNKKVEELTREFEEILKVCIINSKINLWKNIIEILNSDPIFKENRISECLFIGKRSQLLNINENEVNEIIKRASKIFENLSSGHKIVLLTLSGLIAQVEERTLVLIDEPEVHLHPPLLAAFTRAISELLINRNGVAIVATHSPVVLQEVPKSCVWKLRRYGTDIVAERLKLESFGENIGTLTSEVFRHEVTESGVFRILKENAEKFDTFQEVMDEFDGNIGYEAQAFLRILLKEKRMEDI